MDSQRSSSNEGDLDVQGDNNNNYNSNRSSTVADHRNEYVIQQTLQATSVPPRGAGGSRQNKKYAQSSSNHFYQQRRIDNEGCSIDNQNEYSVQKSINQQTPLPSQYNNLVNRREGSAKRYASSNGFRISQGNMQFQKGGAKFPPNSGVDTNQLNSEPQLHNSVCHSCTVNVKALSYSSLYTQNSVIYSQNVPISMYHGLQDSHGLGGPHSSKYLRFEIEVLRSNPLKRQSSSNKLQGSTNFQGINNVQSQSSSNGDIIYLTLSDDTNPLFLYLSTIDVQKFLRIRKEQNIFVEFSHLADKIQALLDFCIANRDEDDDDQTTSARDLNRFICVMNNLDDNEEDAVIDIFEHNEFRNLLHLRLDFKKASHEETSQWLAKKILMQRKLNFDLQQENFELADQHEQDRQRINQIKQSLIALKATQNEELQRIKDEHESQIEIAEEQKQRILNELKLTYEAQIQDLTSEFDERIQEIKQDADSLRNELLKSQSHQKHQSDILSERETKIDEQNAEIQDLSSERARLQQRVESLKDQNNELDKRLLEQNMFREQLEKEVERQGHTIQSLKTEIQLLEEQNQGQGMMSDQQRENLLIANEQNKQLENENQRLNDNIQQHLLKIEQLKQRRSGLKAEIKEIKEEKAQIEGQNEQANDTIEDQKATIESLQKDLLSRDQTISKLEEKLKEDQQTLMSNKNLIEFLNKSLNEAQKFSFRTMVNQKGQSEIQIIGNETNTVEIQHRTISPLRSTSAGIPKLDTAKLQNSGTSTQYQLVKNPRPYHGMPPMSQTISTNNVRQEQTPLQSEMIYRPSTSHLTLPMTEFYLNKNSHSQTLAAPGSSNYLSFGQTKPPAGHHALRQHSAYNISSTNQQFNHHLNNPFSKQLERERIISEEKLKQRFDEAYQSKYQGVSTTQQNLYNQQFNKVPQPYVVGSNNARSASGRDLNIPKQNQSQHSSVIGSIQVSRQGSQEAIDAKGIARREIEVIDQDDGNEDLIYE